MSFKISKSKREFVVTHLSLREVQTHDSNSAVFFSTAKKKLIRTKILPLCPKTRFKTRELNLLQYYPRVLLAWHRKIAFNQCILNFITTSVVHSVVHPKLNNENIFPATSKHNKGPIKKNLKGNGSRHLLD